MLVNVSTVSERSVTDGHPDIEYRGPRPKKNSKTVEKEHFFSEKGT